MMRATSRGGKLTPSRAIKETFGQLDELLTTFGEAERNAVV
jgi:hypothetical protein